jgi:hypothetical protein
MRDTEILHQEALLLREKMNTVKQEIAKVWILCLLLREVLIWSDFKSETKTLMSSACSVYDTQRKEN